MPHTNSRPPASAPLPKRKGGQRLAAPVSSAGTLLVAFLFLATGILGAGYFYAHSHEKRFLAEAQRQLSAIADLKVGELQLWREERLGDAGVFYRNSAFASLVERSFRHPDAGVPRREIETWLSHIKADRNYNRIFLLDALGNSRISLPASADEPLSAVVRQRALVAMRTGMVTFSDFYRQDTSGKIYLAVLVPISDPARGGSPLGALVLRIDAERYLYPFIKRWPSSSASAETLLVRRDGNAALFLNDLRHRKGAALNLSIPLDRVSAPSALAVLGRESVVRGIDYRGIPVLAALRQVPDSPWFLVAQIAEQELCAPLRELELITALLVGAVLLCAAIGVALVWRQQSSRFYRDRHEAQLENRELQERLTRIAASVPGALFQFHLCPGGPCFFPFVSHGLAALYGISPEALAQDAAPFFEAIHPGDAQGVAEAFRQSARTLSPWRSEHRVLHPERGEIWLEGVASPEPKPDGSVQFYGFLSDSTERKRAAADLARQSALIEEKNAELERFTYTVSHDLKSPLVTIKTFLGYLAEDLGIPENPRVEQDLLFMHGAADKMALLLSELLELSRVGRLNSSPVQSCCTELAREAAELNAGSLSTLGVAVQISPTPVALFGDRARLLEIWQNLVENAAKFMGSQKEPRIVIGSRDSAPGTVFFVQDNGRGIDPRYHEKIFGLFDKLDAGSEGTGLGLALVKRIVQTYEGKIWVESSGKGEGATFFFTLPLAQELEVPDVPRGEGIHGR